MPGLHAAPLHGRFARGVVEARKQLLFHCRFVCAQGVPDPDRVLGDARRVLRPGGRLAILSASNRPATRLATLPYLRGGMRLHDGAELAEMPRAAGFTDIDVTSRGFVQYACAAVNTSATPNDDGPARLTSS